VVSSRLFKLLALLVLGIGTLIGLWWLSRGSKPESDITA
jgi:hypothetical protein